MVRNGPLWGWQNLPLLSGFAGCEISFQAFRSCCICEGKRDWGSLSAPGARPEWSAEGQSSSLRPSRAGAAAERSRQPLLTEPGPRAPGLPAGATLCPRAVPAGRDIPASCGGEHGAARPCPAQPCPAQQIPAQPSPAQLCPAPGGTRSRGGAINAPGPGGRGALQDRQRDRDRQRQRDRDRQRHRHHGSVRVGLRGRHR